MPPSRKAAWLAAASSIAGFVQLGIVGLALARDEMPIRLARPRWSPASAAFSGPPSAHHHRQGARCSSSSSSARRRPRSVPRLMSWLYYADRVAQLPLGFIASAVGIVLLPELAARHVAASEGGGRRRAEPGARASRCCRASGRRRPRSPRRTDRGRALRARRVRPRGCAGDGDGDGGACRRLALRRRGESLSRRPCLRAARCVRRSSPSSRASSRPLPRLSSSPDGGARSASALASASAP